MAGTELGTGYISIVAETNRIPGQLRQAFSGAGSVGEAAGRDAGGRMSGALGKALKIGAGTAAAAITGTLGVAITKGIGRLTAIDDAQGKLSGLGHSAQSTAKIMDSALDSVRGTAYGLGDAATIAASAVAAGIKPGAELTKYLSMTADAAAIAGVGLSEMGGVLNQVQTGQVAYTDSLNQLSDRGIPIYQWLAEEAGVAAGEVKDMASEGKISSEMFFAAIQKNIGGAAQEAGQTVTGAMQNAGAALGRFGAVVAGPVFNRAAGGFGSITEAIDGATAAITPFVDKFDRWLDSDGIPKAQEFGRTIAEMWGEFTGSGLVVGSITQVSATFGELLDTGRELAPAIQAIVESLVQASAAVGVSTWQVLLNTLDAAAQVADAVLVPALSTLSELMVENQGAVTALVLAFAAFKTLPALGAAAAAAFAPLRTSLAATSTSTAGVRASFAAMRGDFRNLSPQIGRVGAAMRALGNNSATIRNMQNAFINSSTAAGGFAGAIRAGVTPALGGLRAAASGVRNLFSGGLGIGLAIVAATQFVGAMDDMEDSQNANLESANKLAEAQRDVGKALQESRGVINEDVFDALTQQMETYRQGLERTASEAPGLMNDITNWVMPKWEDGMSLGERWDAWWGGANDDLQEAGRVAEETADALRKVGASNRDIADAMSGSDLGWSSFLEKMRSVGGASDEAIESLERQREELQRQQGAARDLTPGIGELADSFKTLADSAASADDKSSALKRTLDILAGVPPSLGDAMQDYNELVRDTAEATAEAWDQSKGWADALIGQNGSVDTSTENGARLRDSILDIKNATADVVASGGDLDATLAANEDMFRALAESAGLSFDEIMKIAAAEGYLPEAFDIGVRLDGDGAVVAGLDLIRTYLENFPDKPIEIDPADIDPQVLATLREMGFEVEKLQNENIRISADNSLAIAALDAVLDKVHEVGGESAVPEIGADDTMFRIVDQNTLDSLGNIDRTQVSPEIGAIIDQFLAGESVTLEKLAALDTSKANPEVLLQIQQALANAQVVNAAIDDAARKRTAEIAVQFAVDYGAARNANPGFVGPLSVTPRANGGIDRLPENARIEPGRGAGLVQWAEGETGGEAFIPLAESKRARSTAILGDVAERFGYRLEKFADGGIRRALDAATAGNGIKYVWGGTGPNGWDCSGWVGYLQQILMGATPSEAAGRRLYTTYSLLGGSTAGLQPGSGPAGTVFVVGTSDEHMAATLNGQPVESGGAHGTSRIGPPAVGAFDSQFHSIFHLPNEMIDGGTEGISGIGAYAVEREPWTEKDQLDLESARIAVQQAKEARDKTYANEKKSDADKAQADLKVQRAELKVRELENKRDGVGVASAISTEPAPPLTGDMDESAIQLRQAEISVLDAQLARDKVYNDPDSTSLDKEKADLQVHSAKNSLEETKKRIAEEEEELATGGGKDGSSGGEFSLKDRLKKFGSDVFGIIVDSVIEQASPFGESRWLSIPFPDFTPPKEGETVSKKGGKKSKDSDKKPIDELSIPANFPGADEQLGFDPGQGIPKWVQQHLKKLPLKVFDTGGWLKPNEMAINLSNKPEPIFNSPQQLLQFAGAQLDSLVPAAGGGNDYSVHIYSPHFVNESKMMRAARDKQELARMRNGGRPF
ncbi:tape measure domain-containing protein [Rhodococcus pyridinivorans]|uniref:tape measure protein n=1 Tax=Rhodococcus pyridinivorans TaxID=103816 RepID=UPI0007CD6C66|nr:tape measure protein [Rhodococcus pyridinivorans]SED50659.1 tape measure domain-containing protein [Rhodococcus pyridinivorans]